MEHLKQAHEAGEDTPRFALPMDLSSASSDAGLDDSDFDANSVSNLGQGANVNGQVVNEFGKYDAGVEFGTAGTGKDDIWTTSFVLDHDSIDLT